MLGLLLERILVFGRITDKTLYVSFYNSNGIRVQVKQVIVIHETIWVLEKTLSQ
jgi:hypothetical protein